MSNSAAKAYHLVKKAGHLEKSRLSRWKNTAEKMVRLSETYTDLSNEELLNKGRLLQGKAKSGIDLNKILIESYALVREATFRALNIKHFPVQLMGGIAMFEGHIAEMQTGEGKTITAVLAAFLRALSGKGCHVITVNDYLAERDSEEMGKIYEKLGLSVGCILSSMEPDERREAYRKDITYGTGTEMGFDFLRDRLKKGASTRHSRHFRWSNPESSDDKTPVQRGYHFALIDEADSILIDEAVTPLIIGLHMPNDAATVNLFRWSSRAINQLAPEDYIYEPDKRSAFLTDEGCRKVILMPKPSLLDVMDTEKIYSFVEKAITAKLGFMKDRDYVIYEDEVVIIDESTGRMMEGRKWQDGLHQAVEAQDTVPITAETGQAAKVTIQNFFREYVHLAGMTGTAIQAKKELSKTYELKVSRIPTNKKCIRTSQSARVFISLEDKWHAVALSIKNMLDQKRSVLVGTPSVNASEELGDILKKLKVGHQILNAKYHEQESEIVSLAGEPGRVTIATNMAGRGTDIKLHPDVKKNGGLHVIATEMHSSARIDRQLVGRSARQGDPGSFQFFLSMEDEVLRVHEKSKRDKWIRSAKPDKQGEMSGNWISLFRKTQKKLEKSHRKARKMLLKNEKQKTELYDEMGIDPYLELTE
jgi:preprotein translocase subunit SecA